MCNTTFKNFECSLWSIFNCEPQFNFFLFTFLKFRTELILSFAYRPYSTFQRYIQAESVLCLVKFYCRCTETELDLCFMTGVILDNRQYTTERSESKLFWTILSKYFIHIVSCNAFAKPTYGKIVYNYNRQLIPGSSASFFISIVTQKTFHTLAR